MEDWLTKLYLLPYKHKWFRWGMFGLMALLCIVVTVIVVCIAIKNPITWSAAAFFPLMYISLYKLYEDIKEIDKLNNAS